MRKKAPTITRTLASKAVERARALGGGPTPERAPASIDGSTSSN